MYSSLNLIHLVFNYKEHVCKQVHEHLHISIYFLKFTPCTPDADTYLKSCMLTLSAPCPILVYSSKHCMPPSIATTHLRFMHVCQRVIHHNTIHFFQYYLFRFKFRNTPWWIDEIWIHVNTSRFVCLLKPYPASYLLPYSRLKKYIPFSFLLIFFSHKATFSASCIID